jgi:hypothetical protein
MTFWLIWLALAVTVGILAKQRGRGVFTWFLIGAVLSPLLGFVLLMMGKDLALVEAIDTITHDMEMTHVKCHQCAEYVMPEATVCPYCNAKLEPSPEHVRERMNKKLEEEAELRKERQLNFLIAIGVAVGLAILAWLSTFL